MNHSQIFRRAHAGHATCLADEWHSAPCPPPAHPLVWSRRNGPWREVGALFVGAAPGNAGGRGTGDMGAHATRIPFGGDVAGANLDVLLASAGLTRDEVFLVAALNRLPDAGGGEPTARELSQPVGDYETSLHLLRDTMLAARPRLVVALGNVGLRATIAAARLADDAGRSVVSGRVSMPSLERLKKAGLERNVAAAWPVAQAPDPAFAEAWGPRPLPHVLWLTHPSAQNMSPYARVETAFHTRMLEARDALRAAVAEVLGVTPPAIREDVPLAGAVAAADRSIYDLAEWREAVGARHRTLDRLWRSKGV